MNRTPRPALVGWLVLASAAALTAQSSTLSAHAELAARIAVEGLEHSEVMRFEDELCNTFGSRLTGSLAFDRAADWAVAQFRAMGLDARLAPWGEWKGRVGPRAVDGAHGGAE